MASGVLRIKAIIIVGKNVQVMLQVGYLLLVWFQLFAVP